MRRIFARIRPFVLILGSLFLLTHCTLKEPADTDQSVLSLKLINSFALDVKEPSGLALNPDGKSLWTVSDNTNQVYQLSLTGQILQTLSYQGRDLEGIAIDTVTQTFWLAEEHSRELVELDSAGLELQRHRILEGNDNSGLEGICIDTNHHFFTLKEKKPGLFLSLNPDFCIKNKLELTFANDYSGLCADTLLNRFWILSDQDESLYYWDLNDGVIKKYKLGITGPEGIAIDFKNEIFYVVSDPESRLYVFKK
ncbi:hypothetical protein DRI50_09025 [candidate division KSB1 bacterium]|nr:MAG: hypothetical protein DRI50_09025 [candidate division KSB1 bacterium]